jgi:hypothetical protein
MSEYHHLPSLWAVPETDPLPENRQAVEEDDEPLRWYVLAGFVLAVLAGFAVAVWLLLSWAASCPSSGGEDIEVAGDSMRASLCGNAHGSAALLIPLGWVVGLVLATAALVRWGGGVRGTVLLVVLFLSPSLLPAAAYAGLSRSGTTCTGDDLAAYREWVDAGSKGQPPHDCRTF